MSRSIKIKKGKQYRQIRDIIKAYRRTIRKVFQVDKRLLKHSRQTTDISLGTKDWDRGL